MTIKQMIEYGSIMSMEDQYFARLLYEVSEQNNNYLDTLQSTKPIKDMATWELQYLNGTVIYDKSYLAKMILGIVEVKI